MFTFSGCVGFLIHRLYEPGLIGGQTSEQQSLKGQFNIEKVRGVTMEDIRESILKDVPIGSSRQRVLRYINQHPSKTSDTRVETNQNRVVWNFISAGERTITFYFDGNNLTEVTSYLMMVMP